MHSQVITELTKCAEYFVFVFTFIIRTFIKLLVLSILSLKAAYLERGGGRQLSPVFTFARIKLVTRNYFDQPFLVNFKFPVN